MLVSSLSSWIHELRTATSLSGKYASTREILASEKSEIGTKDGTRNNGDQRDIKNSRFAPFHQIILLRDKT
jgi:hypothetical protein